tara:strand:+ start:2904 stop:4433 length:1530 start_codon:yes stop_codon:yes gene_type:complete
MYMKFNSIIVVGGGSAGWMTAATLVKAFPNKTITVVESSNQPVVGVGESTTQLMRRWQNFLEIPDIDFLTKCNATNKLSIRFENFHKKDKVGFHYPFGRLDERYYNVSNWFAYQFHSQVPFEDFVNDCSPINYCIEENKVPDTILPNGWCIEKDAAWHFDTHKFYGYLRDEYCKPKGVKHIIADVTGADQDENGYIEYIRTDQGRLKADLFFDCTGFKRVLIEGVLKEKWTGFNNKTYTNCAWAGARPYEDKKEQLKLYTNSVALDYGWVWEIPTWERIGTGYNYCDDYIDSDDALKEYKNYLGPIANEMEFKHIRMRNGMSERMWVKNCISIGLSGAFIEPLESNGLMSVHEFLLQFVNIAHNKDSLNNFDAQAFNHNCREQFLYFADFISLHYAMTSRDDNHYWKDIQQQNFKDSPLLKQVYELMGCPYWEIENRLSWDEFGAVLYMIAGHKMTPYNKFKDSNANFWGSSLPEELKNLDITINKVHREKRKYTDGFKNSVDYYQKFH